MTHPRHSTSFFIWPSAFWSVLHFKLHCSYQPVCMVVGLSMKNYLLSVRKASLRKHSHNIVHVRIFLLTRDLFFLRNTQMWCVHERNLTETLWKACSVSKRKQFKYVSMNPKILVLCLKWKIWIFFTLPLKVKPWLWTLEPDVDTFVLPHYLWFALFCACF